MIPTKTGNIPRRLHMLSLCTSRRVPVGRRPRSPSIHTVRKSAEVSARSTRYQDGADAPDPLNPPSRPLTRPLGSCCTDSREDRRAYADLDGRRFRLPLEDRIAETRRALTRLHATPRDRCPGDHQYVAHGDDWPPWRDACGFTDVGQHRSEYRSGRLIGTDVADDSAS
jgi:hypothetical protein